MKRCKRCVQPDTRPGIYFDESGVCGACLYQDEVDNTIDWTQRKKELHDIAEWAKMESKKRGCAYDCVIGVSGGKDSILQALTARDILGLRPLLVSNEPEAITEIGWKNRENLIHLGFDFIAFRPRTDFLKKMARADFYEKLNPNIPPESCLVACPYIIMDKFNIPLVIQGENPALTLGARNTKVGMGGDALRANLIDTMAIGWKRMARHGITEDDLFMYHYDREALEKRGNKGVYLQYYMKDWHNTKNAEFSQRHGLTVRPDDFDPNEIGTYAPHSQLDSDIVPVNQLLKYIKFGFGQCTDHACYDIRIGRLTRRQGMELVKKYDGKCSDAIIKKLCDFMEITVEEFWRHANTFRGSMWNKNAQGEWILDDEE